MLKMTKLRANIGMIMKLKEKKQLASLGTIG